MSVSYYRNVAALCPAGDVFVNGMDRNVVIPCAMHVRDSAADCLQ